MSAENSPSEFVDLMQQAGFDKSFIIGASRIPPDGAEIDIPTEVPVAIRTRGDLNSNESLIEIANRSLIRMSALGGLVVAATALKYGIAQGALNEAADALQSSFTSLLMYFRS